MRMMMQSGDQNPFEVAENVINKLSGINPVPKKQLTPTKSLTNKEIKEIEKVEKEDIYEDKP